MELCIPDILYTVMIIPISQPLGPYYEVLKPNVSARPSGECSNCTMIIEKLNLVGSNLTNDESYVVRISPTNTQDGSNSYTVSELLSKYCIQICNKIILQAGRVHFLSCTHFVNFHQLHSTQNKDLSITSKGNK